MIFLGLGLAALIGLSLGVLGGGGSILTVPIFVYVLGFAAKPAIAMTLPAVGTASFIGAVSHWREGNLDLRVALLFGAVAMTGAYLGARLAYLLTGTQQLAILGIVMLGAAISMMRGRPEGDASTAAGLRRLPARHGRLRPLPEPRCLRQLARRVRRHREHRLHSLTGHHPGGFLACFSGASTTTGSPRRATW